MTIDLNILKTLLFEWEYKNQIVYEYIVTNPNISIKIPSTGGGYYKLGYNTETDMYVLKYTERLDVSSETINNWYQTNKVR